MERMPFQPLRESAPSASPQTPPATTNSWRTGLPRLTGSLVALRELRASDAPSLFAALASDQVSRFISPPPATVDGFERFIKWASRERLAGRYLCFAVTLRGSDAAVGIFQVRSLEPAFGTAEWGFALGPEYWGTGMFMDGAKLIVDFAFDVLGTHRLEARAAVMNARGNAALRKLGAIQEGVLRRSFIRRGQYLDQALWTILQDEWLQAKATWGSPVVH
jgi:ribosomal-protein-alanine N-acetyltransferase